MKKLTFNQYQAYILAIQGHKEQFKNYCDSCKFTQNEIEAILSHVNK